MKNEAYARAAVDADDTRADAWYRLLDAAHCCNSAEARNKFILRFTHVSGMPWMLWAVLVISVAGNLAMVPSSVYTPVFRAVLPGEPHPLPVVIPRSRITSEHEQYIPDDAAVFCDLGLKNCIPYRIPGWIYKFRPECTNDGICKATVFFDKQRTDLSLMMFLGPLLFLAAMIVFVVALTEFPGWCDTAINALYVQGFLDSTVSPAFMKRMQSTQRYILFAKATGYQPQLTWNSRHAAYADATTMATFTPEDGFRLRLLWGGAPELPVWRFREVAKPPSPPRIRKEWSEAMKMRDTVGVRMDVDGVIGVEWRADGGMRVWIHERAYDSYVETPANAPASVPE